MRGANGAGLVTHKTAELLRVDRSGILQAMANRMLCVAALGLYLAGVSFSAVRAEPAPEAADPNDPLVDEYIEAWRAFYPSRALDRGMGDAIRDLEDRSAGAIEAWVALNRATLSRIEARIQARIEEPRGEEAGPVARRAARGEIDLPPDRAVDLRLVRAQARRDLATWAEQRIHRTSLQVFVDPISEAVRPVLESPLLSSVEKEAVLERRLGAVVELAGAARELVEDGRETQVRRSLDDLEQAQQALETDLATELAELPARDAQALERARLAAIEAIRALRGHVEERLIPSLTLEDTQVLGRERYARGLALYTDRPLTPERLEEIALQEIRTTKERIGEVAELYLRETSPDEGLPASEEEIVARAFADLEARRPANNTEYLETLREYRSQVETFVREAEIATVPEHHTLSLELAPESAGPMARVGYVSSAPPFDPNPWTTWYLATIPDSYPEPERIDFWSSFNYPFKKFIVVHELFPGHYMQLKLLRENLHQARILFPWSPFTEGWATFCEEVAFEHGYAEGDRLVRLAQLRKRLENANRAYMSVQAHVNGWSEEKVVRTSVEMSLLAPQFARSLWNRLMSWPFQMTTYMLGGIELQELYEAEKERLGPRFRTRDFMDRVLRLGPIPVEEIGVFLELEQPGRTSAGG